MLTYNGLLRTVVIWESKRKSASEMSMQPFVASTHIDTKQPANIIFT